MLSGMEDVKSSIRLSEKKQSQVLLFIYRGLITFLLLLSVVFIIGTIYGVFFRVNLSNPSQVITSKMVEEGQTFTGIGPIRVPTNDPQPGMVIIFVTYIYYPNDRAFSEELVLRVKDFRQIITDYFSSFLTSELQVMGEDTIKLELLQQFNSILRLGKIETLYFSDFIIVE